MNIRQMEIFISVVRYGNFTKAAKEMFLSQPAISSCMELLEKELDTKLYTYQGRKIKLTHAGEKFYEGAVSIIELTEKTVQNIKQTDKMSGTIKIAANYIPAIYYIPNKIYDFKNKFNNVNFQLSVYGSNDVAKSVIKGKYDFGIVGSPIKNDSLKQSCILSDKMVLIAARKEPFSSLPYSLSLDHVRKLPFIVRNIDNSHQTLTDYTFSKHGILSSDLNITAETNDIEVMIEMVKCGLGVAFISSCSIKNYPELLSFEIEGTDIWRNYYLVYLDKDYINPCMSAFIEHIPIIEPSVKNELGANEVM